MMRTYYRVHGMMQSFFTRKMTAYFDYKGISWKLWRGAGLHPSLSERGWRGGFPAVETPAGELIWDSTPMIHYLERIHGGESVFPEDSVRQFLDYAIEDFVDEWMYRPAIGSRWFYEENNRVGGWELARDMSLEMPLSCADVLEATRSHMKSTLTPAGLTEENIGGWIDEVLRPWQRVLGAHFDAEPFLFGGRPSLADFALFGGNAAHFVNDPLCRQWTEEEGGSVVAHTHRLLEPESEKFESWSTGAIPRTLIAVLSQLGRHYLPWVSQAVEEGSATVRFDNGSTANITASEYIKGARRVLLARYVALRSHELDAVLERAGILEFYRDYVHGAGAIPDSAQLPRPHDNRPYAPPA